MRECLANEKIKDVLPGVEPKIPGKSGSDPKTESTWTEFWSSKLGHSRISVTSRDQDPRDKSEEQLRNIYI